MVDMGEGWDDRGVHGTGWRTRARAEMMMRVGGVDPGTHGMTEILKFGARSQGGVVLGRGSQGQPLHKWPPSHHAGVLDQPVFLEHEVGHHSFR